MTKTEIIDQLKDLIRDRESFLDGTDDNIFCRDIAALKGAIELIENGEFPKDQLWIRRKSDGRIDRVSHVVDEGISECIWFEEVDSAGGYATGAILKVVFLEDPAWRPESVSDLISVYAKTFRNLNNILEQYLKLHSSFELYKLIKDGYKWEISGDFVYVLDDATNKPAATFRSEDVRDVIDIER